VPIGDWVVEHACAEAMTWPAYVGVAVNVSSVQFHDRSLVLRVAAILAKTGLSAHRLELEITETVLLEDTEEIFALYAICVSLVYKSFLTTSGRATPRLVIYSGSTSTGLRSTGLS
jgi:EAL domain-containing protein (putative c-di-GMP-specific phosphodiesterase class I)